MLNCNKLSNELKLVKKELADTKIERDELLNLLRFIGNYCSTVNGVSIGKMKAGGLGKIEYGTYKGSAILSQQIMEMITSAQKAKCLSCGVKKFLSGALKFYRWINHG